MPNDWLDSLRADLDIELDGHLPFLKDVWREVSRTPVQPSRQQVVDEWMHMPAEQLQMLAAQLGPQGYSNLVQEKMQAVSSVFGPDITTTLMPYFNQFTPAQSLEEAQYNSLLGLDNTQPLDLESEVDRFLVESIEQETH